MRRIIFENEEFYHIYNRGNDKREIFIEEKDYIRFLTAMREFNRVNPIGSLSYVTRSGRTAKALAVRPLVRIICYCLLGNHYHFILQQLEEGGISNYMKKLNGGHTWYFNFRYKKSGSLFQGKYKAIHIKSNEYLQYLSAYINANPEIHKVALAENYKWSSYQEFLGKRKGNLPDKKIILNEFKNVEEYREYVKIISDSSRQRKEAIKECLLE